MSRDYLRMCLSEAERSEHNEHIIPQGSEIKPSYLGVTSEQAADIIVSHEESKFRKKFIRFCFRHKDSIKKIPIIGRLAVRIKENRLHRDENIALLNMEPYLGMHYSEFIPTVYKVMLGRSPEESAILSLVDMYRNGANNQCIIYLIAISPEYKGAAVCNITQYKKSFKKYIHRRKIKNLPVIGRIVRGLTVPSRLEFVYGDTTYRFDSVITALNNCTQIMTQQQAMIRDLNNKVMQLSDQVILNKNNANASQEKLNNIEREFKYLKNSILPEISGINGRFDEIYSRTDSVYEKISQNSSLLHTVSDNVKNLSSTEEGINSRAASALSKLEQLSKSANTQQTQLEQNARLISIVSQKIDDTSGVLNSISHKSDDGARLVSVVSQKIDDTNGVLNSISSKSDDGARLVSAVSQKIDDTNVVLNSISRKNDDEAELITSVSLKLDNVSQRVDMAKTAINGFTGGVTAVQVGKYLFGVPSEEWGLAFCLSRDGNFEYGSEKLFCELLEPDMVVLDIGANLGIYTLHALSAGCEVYSFEPVPRTYEIMKQNIKANGFADTGKAHTFNCAVSDNNKPVSFYYNVKMCGHSNMFEAEGDSDREISVDCVVLDDLLADIPHIDVVKIDVEGAEYNVLSGMKKILDRNPGIRILIEFAPTHIIRAGRKPEDLLRLIKELGFSKKLISGSGELAEVDDSEIVGCFSENLLLTKE